MSARTVHAWIFAAALMACGARTGLREDGDGASRGGSSGNVGGSAAGGLGSGAGPMGGGGANTGAGPSSGGGLPALNGCADGTREGFVDEGKFPDIAACAGGFAVPGVMNGPVTTCARSAGDDSANPDGAGCSVEDLCSPGFTVCVSDADVAFRSGSGCADIGAEPSTFFITRQSGTGCGKCANGSSTAPECLQCSCAGFCAPQPQIANDVFGCGTVGDFTDQCGVLDRFSNDFCGQLPAPWSCGGGCDEAVTVAKPGAAGGGALCCRGPIK